jgi:protein SCO1/2
MAETRRDWIAGSAPLLAGAAFGWLIARGAGAQAAPASADAAARLEGYFPNSYLKTHDGRRVRFYDDLVRGKVVAVTFMYTTCTGICPQVVPRLVALNDSVRAAGRLRVHFYAISLDPEFDTPRRLAAYARRVGAGEGFTFLSGGLEEVTQIRRRLGVFEPDPALDADRAQHGGTVVFGNEPRGRWMVTPALVKQSRIRRNLARIAPELGLES